MHIEMYIAGVKGIVTYENGTPAAGVAIHVDGRMKVKTTAQGEFWKILLPGTYTLNVSSLSFSMAAVSAIYQLYFCLLFVFFELLLVFVFLYRHDERPSGSRRW